MESVQARQRGSLDFEGYYKQLCALQDTCPLTSVKGHLTEGVLDINGDRVRTPDWPPILNSLRINKNLQFVAVRSYFQQSCGSEDSKDGKVRSRIKRRQPPIRSKDLTYRLCVALKESLSITQALGYVELQGLPLRMKDLVLLGMGIMKNNTLQHLSMDSCRIGDRGTEKICNAIKNSPGIVSLNFSACGLTSKGAESLAKLVKHQSTQRHSEAWKDSLRYRRPDLDQMSGIRRITLNNNPLVNDEGAEAFAEALKDDLWLKALDMQHCGISNVGATAFLDGLYQNPSIVVLDMRKNHLVDRDLLKTVMEQVMINAGGEDHQLQYKWLRANNSSKERGGTHKNRRKTKTLNSSFGRKTTIRVTSGQSSAPPRSRAKPSGDGISVRATRAMEPEEFIPAVSRPGPGFVPWRTAARATHRRVLPDGHNIEVNTSPSSTPSKSCASIHVHAVSSGEFDTSEKDTTGSPMTMMSSMRDTEDMEGFDKRMKRQMQVEIEELHRRLFIESRARAASDAHVVELEVSNSRLRHQIQLLEARSPTSPLRVRGGPSVTAEQPEDESILDSIEESFAKFHGFLDLLREAGLGQLCTLVGMTPGEITSNPQVRSILQKHQPTTHQYYPSEIPPYQYTPHRYPNDPPGRRDYGPESSGIQVSGPPVTPTRDTSSKTDGSNAAIRAEEPEIRPLYLHAPLVMQEGQNGQSQQGSNPAGTFSANTQGRSRDGGGSVSGVARPVVVQLPLSDPPAPQGEHSTETDVRHQVNEQSDSRVEGQQTDLEKELNRPHIEFTNNTGSSGDARPKPGPRDLSGGNENQQATYMTEDRTPNSDVLTHEKTKDSQDHSDNEASVQSSLGSGSHRSSTPTKNKGSLSGSDNPTAATYSVDEDFEDMGSPVLKELDNSDEDLFLDLPTPTKRAGTGKNGNNEKGVRGDDEYSSDEDF
ncbi:centrosomal protein of 78 kDa-like isoform X1 [Asterias rubens]|uniref:centrosomal protein of 78 kDa-like isoform X1 n=1 Tax=Asterias rubens TaxID=7604 RepID=UPI00145539A2|nr:centrosomal protein of 78 kDa-like isoform X1 [Asterias rubens]